jgi:uncharacterized phage protein gp47/JayE
MSLFKARVFTEIFGEMSARLVASTPLTDINYGSVWTTMLEAAAQEDDEQYFQMLEIIRAYSLDTVTGQDLDDKAFEYGLERRTSQTASTRVTIGDASVSKVETGVYSGLSGAPAGTFSINGDSSLGFTPSGNIIIGRGTPRVETVGYSSITVFANYVTFNLSSALAFDHGTDETIILSQGGNRTITSGAIVYTPESDLSPRVEFTLDESATILDGEEVVENVSITALEAGSQANVPVGAITSFDSPPFASAYVDNPSRVTNGADTETDQELRDRIKSHIQSLSRGTGTSIVNSVLDVTSTEDNKRVVSASLVEPTIPAGVVKLYIDDGTGFVSSYNHVGIETIIASATGGEKFLTLNNVPVVKAFVETQNEEPFNLVGGETLFLDINGVVETVTFASSDFAAPGAATAQEIMRKINQVGSLIESRKSSDGKKVKIFARRNFDEQIRVTGGTANDVNKLNFPTDQKYTLKLYKYSNNRLFFLSKDGETAAIESGLTAAYNMSVRRNLCIILDGKVHNPQMAWFDPSDFLNPPSVASLEIVNILNNQLAGVLALRSSNNTKFQFISKTERSSGSKVRIVEKFERVLNEESSVLIDRTNNLSNGVATPVFQSNLDFIYVGISDVRFFSLWVSVATPASANAQIKFEIFDPDTLTWATCGAFDETNGFQNSGHITFGRPGNWDVNLVSGEEKFWLRMQRNVGSLSTTPILDYVKISNANEVFGFSESEVSGQDKDYTFNRFIGQIELEQALQPFDILSAGSTDTRSFVVSSTLPVGLSGGEILNITIDGVAQTVTFQPSDFVTPGTATAAEIATRIASSLKGVTVTTIDAGSKVKIISNTWNNGTLKVTGGTANSLLQFPTSLQTSFVSHFPAVESISGPFAMPINSSLNVVVDNNFANNFELPAYTTRECKLGTTAATLIDTTLLATFPLSSDIVGFKVVMTSGSQSGSNRTIASYTPATGAILLSSALAGAPAIGDTFQIVPITAEQVVKFWNNKLITLISTSASILLSGGGTKVQIASLSSGETASIYVTGGTANLFLGFPNIQFFGVDGYRYHTGLAQKTQWTVDGRVDDLVNYPGIRAAGVQVEVLEPVTVPIRVEVNVTTREGVTLSSISNDIKSSISAYINNLRVGDDVIISEIIVAVKGVTGVFDVKVTTPLENIAIADSELPRIAETEIIVG